jgi:excinuclease ABC subunit A
MPVKSPSVALTPPEQLDPKAFIIIKGARVNNLKNLTVAIPRNKLVVITGLSGSGKSSLAFDTLFAEGQRMYVESLSAYSRQFLGRMQKPEVDYIRGVAPAIAIEQNVSSRNPRSTVGTTTEIYDYLKLLYARIGTTYSPVSGNPVRKDAVDTILAAINNWEPGTRFMVLAPLRRQKGRPIEKELELLLQQGFSRVKADDEVWFIEQLLEDGEAIKKVNVWEMLIDRAQVNPDDEDAQFRLSDSLQTAFFEGEGRIIVEKAGGERFHYSDRFELDGITFEEPSVNFFSFNNPYGACRTCEGFGNVLGIDEDLVIPDKSLSVYEGAILPWRSDTFNHYLQALIRKGYEFNFPIHRAIADLNEEEYRLLWTGNRYFEGLNQFFQHLESQTHKIQYRVLLSRYRGRTICPDCRGTRLRKDASYVKIQQQSITDLVLMPLKNLHAHFSTLQLSDYEQKVAGRILEEILNRLDYMQRVGLGYLTLNRLTSTLSGGEFQRIKLATSLGSALVGSMYILDEPSIGLHPRDTEQLISVLKSLRDLGNTVIVVEHEEKVMQAADQIIDIGPDAGRLGGELVFQGTFDEIKAKGSSWTARYLRGEEQLSPPKTLRTWRDSILIKGARENNLKRIDVTIPLGTLNVISGVSGSGKSTLVKKILYPSLAKMLGHTAEATGKFDKLEGDYKKITGVEYVDQNPIGKSSRSNPVTYVKAYDNIRQLFADQAMSKQRGYKPAFFSFNVDGGRCEECQGEGTITIEMQFMADIHLTCETCKGKRFKSDILDVNVKGKNIADILELTVEEAIAFFKGHQSIIHRLQPLNDVGLGYIKLGQSSSSLSGGEAQRVKLASYLGKNNKDKEHMLFIFDEPTTGLHFHDIKKLLAAINALVDQGNTALIIEHNTDVIASADYLIDLGPEGGEAGGEVLYQGPPSGIKDLKKGHTWRYLN